MRRIVIPLEQSEISTEIVPIVQRLFAPDDTELTLLAVAQPPDVPVVASEPYISTISPSVYSSALNQEEWNAYRNEISERLSAQARMLRAHGYRVTTKLLTGNTVHEIVRFVEENNFDLLAMATYGRKGLSRLVFGSIAESVLRLVTVPMLLARHQPKPEAESTLRESLVQSARREQRFQILSATDGSPHAQEAIAFAADLAAKLDASLRILVTIRGQTGSAHGQEVMSKVQKLLRQTDIESDLVPLVGHADEVLGQYLENHTADLLVLGSFQDRSNRGAADIGLTAHRVVQYAQMPVMMVKRAQAEIGRFLVYVDTDDEQPVLDSALELGRALNAEIHVLHVIPAPADVQPERLSPDDEALQRLLEQDPKLAAFLQTLNDTLDNLGLSRDTLQIWRGDIVKTILQIAEDTHEDLIVVGSQQEGGFFPGSVADDIVRFSPQSVLITRARVNT